MMESLVRGRYVLVRADLEGASQLLTDGAVAQQNGVILMVGPYEDLRKRYQNAKVIGNGRGFLLPGLVNAHNHGRGVSTLQMGQPDGPVETLGQRGWGSNPLDPYLLGLYTAMRQARSGTTTVMLNQVAAPLDRAKAEAEATLRAYQEVGLRVAFSITYRNQCVLIGGDDDAFLASLPVGISKHLRAIVEETSIATDDYLALCDQLARRYRGSNDAAIRILVSPQNYHWCDEATLKRIAEFARQRELGIHMHLAETLYQRLYAEKLYGQTPARRLHQIGFLGPDVSLAHGVWLTQEDIALLAETGTGVCHNPGANLRLSSGVAPILEMLRQGVPVALGTDSLSVNDDDDMFQEMGLAFCLHRPPGLEELPITAHQVLSMATLGGARVTTFGNAIGALLPGYRADMVLLDWDGVCSPYLDEDMGPVEAMVARARARDVQAVMVDGRVIYQAGVFPGLDEEAVRSEIAAQLAQPVPESTRQRRRLRQEVEPYLRRFYQGWDLQTTPFYRYHSLR